MASVATAWTNAPRLVSCAAWSTAFSDAAVSFASSIGPPGSDSEIAMPATNGARLTRVHSSVVKSALSVIHGPLARRVSPASLPVVGAGEGARLASGVGGAHARELDLARVVASD